MSKQTAQHTPGPWTLGPDIRSSGNLVYRQVLSGSKRLCAVSVYGAKGKGLDPTFTEPEVQANAALIAAAPDMLAACEDAIDRVPPNQRAMLRAAIAKARTTN